MLDAVDLMESVNVSIKYYAQETLEKLTNAGHAEINAIDWREGKRREGNERAGLNQEHTLSQTKWKTEREKRGDVSQTEILQTK